MIVDLPVVNDFAVRDPLEEDPGHVELGARWRVTFPLSQMSPVNGVSSPDGVACYGLFDDRELSIREAECGSQPFSGRAVLVTTLNRV